MERLRDFSVENRREGRGVDVAAGDDADGFAGAGLAGEGGGDGRRGGALGDDPIALREELDGGGGLRDGGDEGAGQKRARERPHLREHGFAADSVHEGRGVRDGAAVSISDAQTRVAGRRARRAAAMPQERPPPPKGTIIASTSGRSSRISSPIVAFPAMTVSSLTG